MQQTSILEWCSLNTQLLSKPSSVPVGVLSLKRKMGFGAFKECTVEEMVNSSHLTIHGQTAGSYLRWICTKGGTFNWTWTNVKQMSTHKRTRARTHTHTHTHTITLSLSETRRFFRKCVNDKTFSRK
jgi:hypothetical protein